jgi:FAD-dependent oxidoreductase family protein
MPFRRRDFLALAFPSVLRAERGFSADIAILGGGVGGCAAALAALRNGMRVVMTEESDWIGGQLTAQAVPPDEHRWIESFGATRSYRAYRAGVRGYYRRNYPLTAEARAAANLNPGGGTVSALTHEPRVSLAVLESMLAPYLSARKLTLLLKHKPIAADAAGDSIRSVTVRDLDSGATRTFEAAFFLDATELGDLLPLAGVEFLTGFESRAQTGEPHAPEQAQPANQQAFTVCFAMDHVAGENHVIDKPEEYAFWRDYVPPLRPAWPGKLFSFTYTNPTTLEPRTLPFDPECDATGADGGWWTYRRIARRRNFTQGAYDGDVSLVNWPQNDYLPGPLIGVSEEAAARHIQRAGQQSLSLLYWLQTEAPRPDGGRGWPGLRLRPDVTGTANGLAKSPYIREARRIRAEFTILEQHAGADARKKATRAEEFPDSVGVGSYRIDLHPSTGGDNYLDIPSLPFQIPLGALIPRRIDNLLAAAKNIGTTHITNGCYRLHPVEWNIGESAGLAAAHSVATRTLPRHIRNNARLLREFQSRIQEQGVEIAWPRI